MKNSEVCYPIDGSSALRVDLDDASSARKKIIAFPGVTPADSTSTSPYDHSFHQSTPNEAFNSVWKGGNLMDTEFVRSLRYGSARGIAFNRIERWQAIAVGFVFSAIAFAALFFSI